jgi:hypothetical protein
MLFQAASSLSPLLTQMRKASIKKFIIAPVVLAISLGVTGCFERISDASSEDRSNASIQAFEDATSSNFRRSTDQFINIDKFSKANNDVIAKSHSGYDIIWGKAEGAEWAGTEWGYWVTAGLQEARYRNPLTARIQLATIHEYESGFFEGIATAPSPISLLGIGAAFGWSRRLRQRIRSRRQ